MTSTQPDVAIYAALFLCGWAGVLILTPLSIKLAHRVGAIDQPTPRKVHSEPTPRLGGLAVAVSILATIGIGYVVNPYIRSGLPEIAGLLAGSMIILGLGLYDDVYNARPLTKLAVQIGAALIVVFSGIEIELASNPLAGQVRNYFDLGHLSIPLTVIWIVGLTNAMNLIDGLDGLATGIAMFASMALFLISIQGTSAGIVTYFYASIAGATLAFLKYGRFPAKVFLGDGGSTFLGFSLAGLAVLGMAKSYSFTVLSIPMIIFGVPIFDSIVTLIRRFLSSEGLMQADRQHIHHRLIGVGLNQRQAVWILYGVTIVLGIIGFTFTVLLDEYAAVIVVIIGVLGGFLAKELRLFGSSRDGFGRDFRYKELEDR